MKNLQKFDCTENCPICLKLLTSYNSITKSSNVIAKSCSNSDCGKYYVWIKNNEIMYNLIRFELNNTLYCLRTYANVTDDWFEIVRNNTIIFESKSIKINKNSELSDYKKLLEKYLKLSIFK